MHTPPSDASPAVFQTPVCGLNSATYALGNIDISATLNMGISSTLNMNTTCTGIRTDTTALGWISTTAGFREEINLAAKQTVTTGPDQHLARTYQVVAPVILLN